MAEMFGERRKQLLRHLFRKKAGATVKELVQVLGVTRTAVRQHLAALKRDGLVTPGATLPSGGRPKRLVMLTPAGREMLPRHYAWFGELVTDAVEQHRQTASLAAALRRIAAAVVARQGPPPKLEESFQAVEKLSAFMDRLGYDARPTHDADGRPAIEANHCMFHELAKKHPAAAAHHALCMLHLLSAGTREQSKIKLAYRRMVLCEVVKDAVLRADLA